MKKQIKLKESQLREIIKESIKKILNENLPSNAGDLRRSGFGYTVGGTRTQPSKEDAYYSALARQKEQEESLDVRLDNGRLTSTPGSMEKAPYRINFTIKFNDAGGFGTYDADFSFYPETNKWEVCNNRYRSFTLSQNDYNTVYQAISNKFGKNLAQQVVQGIKVA